jgi:hypothetical protein
VYKYLIHIKDERFSWVSAHGLLAALILGLWCAAHNGGEHMVEKKLLTSWLACQNRKRKRPISYKHL